MAWNNGFPATYQQMYPQGFPMGQMYGQPMPAQNTTQAMTPPTIRADIIQVEDEDAAERFPLAAGTRQIFMTRPEDKIIIKTMSQTGALPLEVFVKRPQTPSAPRYDLTEYVRKDELAELVRGALAADKKEDGNGAV
jgi:hypothetical protein